MRVEYHPAVERELELIRNYYEDRSPGLGREFIDEYENILGNADATRVECDRGP